MSDSLGVCQYNAGVTHRPRNLEDGAELVDPGRIHRDRAVVVDVQLGHAEEPAGTRRTSQRGATRMGAVGLDKLVGDIDQGNSECSLPQRTNLQVVRNNHGGKRERSVYTGISPVGMNSRRVSHGIRAG